MLTQSDIELVQDSFLTAIKDKYSLSKQFYDRLYTVAPKTKMIFSGDQVKQQTMLISVMSMIIKGLEDPDSLHTYLYMLGESHANMGVRTQYYHVFTEVFIETIVNRAGIQPDDRLEAAWRRAFGLITPVMKKATKEMGTELHKIRM